jgi:Fe-S-cluster containining protein
MFSHIYLKEGDRERLQRCAYPSELIGEESVPLPCPMLSGTRCTIYEHRPTGCAAFRCEVLKGAEEGRLSLEAARAHVRQAKALLARLREVMPEGVSMAMARARWGPGAASGQPLEPETAAAQLAFFAYYRYMDRHFLPPAKWLVSRDPEARPDDDEAVLPDG